jgi:hypothetical protein
VAGQPGDSQRAKYVVVAVGEAMTSGVPDPTGVTPQLPEYHWSVPPDPPRAVSEMVPASSAQKFERFTLAEVGAAGPLLTFTSTVAHVWLTQLVLVLRARA